MHIACRRLMILLNALYDQGVDSIPIEHPCDDIGELLRIELEDDGKATVRFRQGSMTYEDTRETIPAKHGEAAYQNLPDAQTYTRMMVASGHAELKNIEEVVEFVNRYGYADLEAGNDPVVVGLDANITPWRLPEVLGFDNGTGETDAKGRRPTNGYALATGVKQELGWHFKQYNTHELTAAFGSEFERLDNQPAGANREGLLGLYEYRRLRTDRIADVVESDTGDEAMIDGYRRFNDESQKQTILFSNDHGFVERSLDARVPAQVIQFPVDISREETGSWTQATESLYYLAVLFGVVVLPKITVYGGGTGRTVVTGSTNSSIPIIEARRSKRNLNVTWPFLMRGRSPKCMRTVLTRGAIRHHTWVVGRAAEIEFAATQQRGHLNSESNAAIRDAYGYAHRPDEQVSDAEREAITLKCDAIETDRTIGADPTVSLSDAMLRLTNELSKDDPDLIVAGHLLIATCYAAKQEPALEDGFVDELREIVHEQTAHVDTSHPETLRETLAAAVNGDTKHD